MNSTCEQSPQTGRPFNTERDIASIRGIVNTERDIASIRDIVNTDRRKNVQEISDTSGMCANGVYPTIIHNLGVWKGCPRWLP